MAKKGRPKGKENFQIASYYTEKQRDEECERLRVMGFDIGRCWTIDPNEYHSKALYCFKYRLNLKNG